MPHRVARRTAGQPVLQCPLRRVSSSRSSFVSSRRVRVAVPARRANPAGPGASILAPCCRRRLAWPHETRTHGRTDHRCRRLHRARPDGAAAGRRRPAGLRTGDRSGRTASSCATSARAPRRQRGAIGGPAIDRLAAGGPLCRLAHRQRCRSGLRRFPGRARDRLRLPSRRRRERRRRGRLRSGPAGQPRRNPPPSRCLPADGRRHACRPTAARCGWSMPVPSPSTAPRCRPHRRRAPSPGRRSPTGPRSWPCELLIGDLSRRGPRRRPQPSPERRGGAAAAAERRPVGLQQRPDPGDAGRQAGDVAGLAGRHHLAAVDRPDRRQPAACHGTSDSAALGLQRAVLLPALACRIDEIVDAIVEVAGAGGAAPRQLPPRRARSSRCSAAGRSPFTARRGAGTGLRRRCRPGVADPGVRSRSG